MSAFHERPAAGDAPHGGLDDAWVKLYDELRRIASLQLRREADGHTLSTTALVHEAYLKLAAQEPATWSDRPRFLGIASQAMRRILVDHARKHHALRRGGPKQQVLPLEVLSAVPELDALAAAAGDQADALLALDEALERLGTFDQRLARIVECRFFAGLSEVETAEVLGLSRRTVARDWAMARGWLYSELANEGH